MHSPQRKKKKKTNKKNTESRKARLGKSGKFHAKKKQRCDKLNGAGKQRKRKPPFWEPIDHLQDLFGVFSPPPDPDETQQRLKKSPGPAALDTPKSGKGLNSRPFQDFLRGPRTTHHPHKRPSSSSGIFRGWCVNCRNLRKRQNMHHPQFCTRDVDRRFCGGGAWMSRSDGRETLPSFWKVPELPRSSPATSRHFSHCGF